MFKKKIGNVFNPHKNFPGHQLIAVSRKSLEIQASSKAKQKTLSNQTVVLMRVFSCFNTSGK